MFGWIKRLFKKIFHADHSDHSRPIESKPIPNKPKIALVRGHKRSAPGALNIHGVSEYDYYSEILPQVFERTENTREFLRDGTTIEGAIQDAVNWGADIIIEFHCDAYNGSVNGSSTWIYDESQRAIASDLLVDWLNFSGKSNRGVKKGGRATTSTRAMYRNGVQGCLFEPFFGDNANDYVPPQVLQIFLIDWINEKQSAKA